jgi:hypothetical protein
VRNILQRPKPRDTPVAPATSEKTTEEKPKSRSIPAWYPNHVWSVDTTKVRYWGLWPIHILVAIDHFFAGTRLTAYRLKTAAWSLFRGSHALATHCVCPSLQ